MVGEVKQEIHSHHMKMVRFINCFVMMGIENLNFVLESTDEETRKMRRKLISERGEYRVCGRFKLLGLCSFL